MKNPRRLVIWNPGAGSAVEAKELQMMVQSHPGTTLRTTSSRDQAADLANHARRSGFDVVVAAGGDGTVNAVVNGLYQSDDRAILGILPLGTGNDLCRTLGIPLDPVEAFEFLVGDESTVSAMDLVRVEGEEGTTVFANVCSGGNSDRVGDSLTDEMKHTWGAWSYLRGAVAVLTDLVGFNVVVNFDDQPDLSLDLWNIVVANGKTVGGGLNVAPPAKVADGLLDVILIRNGVPLDIAALSTKFFLGDYLKDDRVIYRKVRRVQFRSDPAVQFVADGDALATTPVIFSVEPLALRVVAQNKQDGAPFDPRLQAQSASE